MSSKTRIALAGGAAVAAVTLMVGVPSAAAAPASGNVFTVTCPGGDPFTVVSPGGGAFTPAFISGITGVFIPYQITGEVTVDDEVVETINDVKKAPLPANAVTCTFTATFTPEEGVTATVSGTVVGVLRGD
jgi:hypothetical protein